MLDPVKVNALKTATQQLIGALGGLAAAETVCRVSVPVLSTYQSRNHPTVTMPIDVVLQLEAVAGEPIVTGALARLQGCVLGRGEGLPGQDVGRAVADMARHAGEVSAGFIEANADGLLDVVERARLVEQGERIQQAVGAMLSALVQPPQAPGSGVGVVVAMERRA